MIGEEDMKVMLELERQGAPPTYFLSLPIPDSATVLFVTDRMDWKEMNDIMQAADTAGNMNILPYILCLVSSIRERTPEENWKLGCRVSAMKIISLHQEKP